MGNNRQVWRAATALIGLGLSGRAEAQHISIDGSLSPAQTLVGPSYTIGANLGKQIGGNLFQSFGVFGLSRGESATFTGPATVTNVIGRVTGGSASSINGAINSTISGANVYLINPAGIVFGPKATINVSGSFRAATADYLKMSDGSRFQATNPGGSTLSAAPPAAFGFLTAAPPAITVNGSTLAVNQGQTLGLAGGTVNVAAATLQAPAGKIRLSGIASTGEVPVAPGGAATVTAHGPVNITGGATIDVSDPNGLGSGGSVFVRAGNLTIGNSAINGDNYGAGSGGGVSLSADSQIALSNQASVHADAPGNGAGPAIVLTTPASGAITIDDSTVAAESHGAGQAGTIGVTTGSLSLTDAGQISTSVFGSGNGGGISVNVAGPLSIVGIIPSDGQVGGGHSSGIFAETSSTGNSGQIAVTAGSLSLTNAGEISSSTFGAGNAGTVSVAVAGPLSADGNVELFASGIISDSTVEGTGNAGQVTVSAGSLSLTEGAQISSSAYAGAAGTVAVAIAGASSIIGETDASSGVFSTSTKGNAGSVAVRAGSLSLSDNAAISTSIAGPGNAGSVSVQVAGPLSVDGGLSGIFSRAAVGSTGNAGQVNVAADALSLANTGAISTTTFGAGNGGDIGIVVSGLLSLGGTATGIFSKADFASTGNAGRINVSAGDLSITDAAAISSSTIGPGNAGTVAVNVADTLSIDGTGAVPQSFSTGIFATAGLGSTGNAGQVSVSAGTMSIANQGAISSSTFNTGAGGQVTVTAQDLSLAGVGTILSSTFAAGSAGQVSVSAANLSMISGGEINSTTFGLGNAGAVTVSVPGTLTVDGALATSTFPTGIFAQSNAAKSGNSGNAGLLDVAAGSILVANGGVISTSTFTNGNAGQLTVFGDAVSIVNQGKVSSSTSSSGAGGQVTVTTQDLALAGDGTILSSTFAGGNAGQVSVSAANLSMVSGGEISSTTIGPGNAGAVAVSVPGTLTVDGTLATSSSPTGIFAQSVPPKSGNSGNAGLVDVDAGTILVTNGGVISTSTFSNGNAGQVVVNAGDLSVTNAGDILSLTTSSGNAGDISISADMLSVSGGGKISTTTTSSGKGGAISLASNALTISSGTVASNTDGTGAAGTVNVAVAGNLSIDGGGAAGSGILSNVLFGATGNGGAVNVTTQSLSLTDFGQIAASTFGAGNSGKINISSGSATIASGGQISTTTNGGATGAGGDIGLAVRGDILLSGAFPQIAAGSKGSGNAGSITVSAANLTLQDGAGISTQAATANGGNITLSIGDFLYLVNSEITTSVRGSTGNGGNVTIDPQLLVLDHSSIVAQAIAGHGGNITIVAGEFIASPDSVVSASSQLGISGSVELIGPRVDLNGSLVVLSDELRDAARVLRTSCEARGRPQSSLVDKGRGGLPQDTETTIPALYIVNRDVGRDAAIPAGAGGMRGGALPLPPLRETAHLTMGCG